MNTNASTRLRTRSVLIRCLACALGLLLVRPAHAVEPDRAETNASPFAALHAVPDSVDAAAVFNNPAQSLLLSDSGRTIRTALATAGIFTHTEHAWVALAQTLGDDTDATITALLGKRVVVVWRGIRPQPITPFGFADAIDTRWALICEVDQPYLKQIRDRLKPVKRDIVHGRPLYAIEKGRYGIVLLDAPDDSHPARVLLAPRDGTELLKHVLASMLPIPQGAETAPPRSIMQGREMLARQLTPAITDSPWAVSWVVQTRRPDAPTGPRRAVVGLVNLDRSSLHLRFATDIPVPNDLGDAPAALLDAVDRDAPLALATARLPGIFVADHSLNLSMTVGAQASSHEDSPSDTQDMFNAPGLLLLSTDQRQKVHAPAELSTTLTVLVCHPKPDRIDTDTTFAAQCDAFMGSLISAYDPAQSPEFLGKFPAAVRTQPIAITPQDASGDKPREGWPGLHPRLSWVSGDLRASRMLIASLGAQSTDTAEHVRQLQNAAQTLDSIADDQPPPAGTLLRGHLRPAEMFRLLGEESLIDLALSRLVDRVSCDIERSPMGGVRGSLTLEVRSADSRPNLGQ